MTNLISKLINSIPSSSERSSKFSLYIIAFIGIIVIILGFSIKTQEKVIKHNFENNIFVTSSMLETNLEDPLAGNDFSYIEKIISSLTEEHTSIIYIIIQNPQGLITISNLNSFSSKDAKLFEQELLKNYTPVKEYTLKKKDALYLRSYFISDIKQSLKEISDIYSKNPQLKHLTKLEQIKKEKKETDKLIFELENKAFRLTINDPENQKLLKQYQTTIKSFNKKNENLNQLIFLKSFIHKHENLLDKIPNNNNIFEAQIPLKNDFGTLKIGYSPKNTNSIIGKMYFISFLTSLLFISIGIFIAFQLILVRNNLENLVTERTKELNESLEKLENTNTHLFKALEHKNRFINTMSHEFRTPLNAIIGFSELLKSSYYGELNEKQQDYAVIIKNAGDHLLSLVNDILDVVKIDTSGLSLKFENFKIKDAIEEVVELIQSQYDDKGLTLKAKNLPEDTIIIADRTKCKQVVLNLLSNALKFTPPGGEVQIKTETVDNKFIKILVKDNGMGIEKDEIDKVFMEFYQSKYVHKKALGGTGIGLALSKKIIELHEGNIGVYSTPQEGSTFWFTLPLVKSKITKKENVSTT